MAKRGKGGALDAVTNLCLRRGFMFEGSGVHGGAGTTYDFGPLGAQLKKNIADAWWRDFVQRRPDCVGLDTGVVLNPKVWEASGHVENFSDPLAECKSCNHRARADKLIEDVLRDGGHAMPEATVAAMDAAALTAAIAEHEVACPTCGAQGGDGLGEVMDANLLFHTRIGPMGDGVTAYLRPETAQGAYAQLLNVASSMRLKLPFGVAQSGKSFRNEIRTSQFVFRAREFEQMELQFFCHPSEELQHHAAWVDTCHTWLLSTLGLSADSVRARVYEPQELAHYASATTDLEFKYPFGWGELWGVACRGDYDLNRHAAASGVDLAVPDYTGAKVVPHVVEPAVGLGRLVLAALCDAYTEEVVPAANGGSATRTVLRLHPDMAPYQVAVLPLMKKDGILECAQGVHRRIVGSHTADFDQAGSIGKRYRRQDEVGTPFCATVDYDTLKDSTVTVRCRDTMRQARVDVAALERGPLTREALGLV